ncbi:hypothetical protein CMK11_21275 [Candidatus Poribacteria bacterium]|nr:hypothetical protein [Candidatus Poribacteria bacterium]
MSADLDTVAQPIDNYIRYQEMVFRRQQRLLRAAMRGMDGADARREELVAQIRGSARKRRNEEELQERLYLVAFLGGEDEYDALVELVTPEDEEDPQYLDIAEHPLLRDEETRAGFYAALGTLGQQLGNRDSSRLETLAQLLRRGMSDEAPDVKIAAAGAVSRSVKYSRQGMAHYAPLVRPLLRMLGDPGWSVKRAAVSALADIPTPESQRALERFGSREEDLHLKRFAAWALNRVRERSGVFRSLLDSVRKTKR